MSIQSIKQHSTTISTYSFCRTIVQGLVERVGSSCKQTWEDLRKMLSSAHQDNRKRPLDKETIILLNDTIDVKLRKSSTSDLIYLLGLVAKYNFLESKRLAMRILATLKEKHSQFEGYLKGKNLIFTPKAIDLILKYHEQLYQWPEGEISLCCVDDLMFKLEEIQKNSTPRALILYSPNQDHVIPAFIKLQENRLKIAIIDSEGYRRNSFWATKLREKLKQRDDLSIYYYKNLRQRDGFSCATFSILDLRNILEGESSDRDLFEFIENHGEIKKIDSPSEYTFNILPPEMMKVTQSFKQLARYRSSPTHSSPDVYFPVFARKSPTHENVFVFQTLDTLDKTVDRNIYYAPDGYRLNKYVEKKYLTFLYRLVKTLASQIKN